MKPESAFHSLLVLLACSTLVLAITGCPIPMQGVSSSASTTGGITGKVLSQGQTDNSGVTITAELTDGIRSVSVQRTLSSRQMSKAAAAAQATTDASGTYTLRGLSPGVYTLSAVSKDGLEKAVTTWVSVGAGSTTQALLMILTRTGQIRGVATLTDLSNPLGIVVFIAGTSYSAMTDANGNYLMSYVPVGSNYTLVASKAGYDSAITSVDVKVNTTSVPRENPLVLAVQGTPQATGSVSGTATLLGATSHAGIFVYLAGTSYICVTDTDGRFSLAGVAPGSYTIMASREGYASQSASVVVPAGPVGPVSFTLPPLGPFYVTYDANGATGSVPVDPTTYMQGYRVVVLGNAGNLARTGYSFAGWNTQADGNGITYTQGQTFSIASSSVVLFAAWSRVVTPPNVAGYWDVIISLQGQAPMDIGWLFIRQNGWDVSITGQGSGLAWAGTLGGQTLTLTLPVPDGSGTATFVGAVTDTAISGPVSAPGFPPATFTMTRVTPTGHLDLHGSCAGTPLSLNTEYARTDGPRTTYFFGFDLSPVIPGRINFEGPSFSVGDYTVANQGNVSGTLRVSIGPDAGPGTQASAGSVTITRYDDTGIAGTYSSISFPDGSSLSGSFELTFNMGGTFTVQGTWMGTPVSAPEPGVQTSWSYFFASSGLNISFFDDLLGASIFLMVPGHLALGDNQLNLSLQWNPAGGSQINGGTDQLGNLHIDSLTSHNLVGSFSATFREGGGITGNINVSF